MERFNFYNTINDIYKLNNSLYNPPINNIISIGDALYERMAIIKNGEYINNKLNNTIYIKTIKYIDNPSLDNMINETMSLLNN